MARPLHILIIEDSQADAELIGRELKRSGLEFTHQRVETVSAMEAALDSNQWDVVISDYQMPAFNGLAALEILKRRQLDVPFIIVSGAIGEQQAVEAMKAGAHDYLLKDNLARLVPALERGLRDAENRRERKHAEKETRRARERLQKLSSHLLQVQETERRHLARELHDEIGQALTATKINLQALLRFPDPGALAQRLQDSVNTVDTLLQQVRNISLDLRPPLLDDLGLPPAIRWYLDQQSKRSGLNFQFSAPGTISRFDSVIETACFRIVQEAVTNVIRHAKAQNVTVELTPDAGGLQLIVRDDGVGFNVSASEHRSDSGGSFGLMGMHERVRLAGGQIEFRSKSSGGTEVRALFPPQKVASSETTSFLR